MFIEDVISTKIIVLISKYNLRTFSNMNAEESVQFILFLFTLSCTVLKKVFCLSAFQSKYVEIQVNSKKMIYLDFIYLVKNYLGREGENKGREKLQI